MRIAFIEVQNFRSLAQTQQLEIKNPSILIGPNNEGKSNLLKALVYAMNMITEKSYYE